MSLTRTSTITLAKIGDCFIQGAIISILFVILKAMIDEAKDSANPR